MRLRSQAGPPVIGATGSFNSVPSKGIVGRDGRHRDVSPNYACAVWSRKPFPPSPSREISWCALDDDGQLAYQSAEAFPRELRIQGGH